MRGVIIPFYVGIFVSLLFIMSIISVDINNEYLNNSPIADAGLDQTVFEGEIIHFNGNGSKGSEISEGWANYTIDTLGDVGRFSSIAIDSNDFPHISYRDDTNQNLKYAKWTGGSWLTETADSSGNVGGYSSIALDSFDYPHISYYNGSNSDLKYARWDGGTWDIHSIDVINAVGWYASIALDFLEYPHISYYDGVNEDLKYTRWNGSTWLIQTVDSAGDVGEYSSLKLDKFDNPHISYYDNTNKILKYAKWTGSSWSMITVDSSPKVGSHNSLELDSSSYPHISYFDGTNLTLKYARWNGSHWIIDTIDTKPKGQYSSLALNSLDYPHICYRDLLNKALKYARWDGGSWIYKYIDSSGDVGSYTSISHDSLDTPHISYFDEGNKNLKYAKKEEGYARIIYYEWDFDGSDGLWWDTGAVPDEIGLASTWCYGDNGIYTVTLRIIDELGLEDIDTCEVTVYNIPPLVEAETDKITNEGMLIYIESTTFTDVGWLDVHNAMIDWGDGTINVGIVNESEGTGFISGSHIYGDDGFYTVNVTVTDDDGAFGFDTLIISVENVAPMITMNDSYLGDEGLSITFTGFASDLGSDDLIFEWDFGDSSPVLTNTYYNSGSAPDPRPSPDGKYPFIAQDTVIHTYGDDYNYPVTLRITDDDGGIVTFTATVIIENVDPIIEPFGPFIIDEGSSINITGVGTDSGSDDLTFIWALEGVSTITTTHYNDGLGTDPYPSPEGLFPFSATEMVSQTYGDDGNYSIILTVTDDDGGTTTHETYALVNNVPPTITSLNYNIVMINEPRTIGYWGHQCEVEEPYGDHTGILQEWIDEISTRSQIFSGISSKSEVEDIVQFGDASDMIAMAKRQLMGVWLNLVSGNLHSQSEINMTNLTTSKTVWESILEIEDVILTSSDRVELERVKDIADNINNGIGVAWGFVEFTATALDPGADDLTFHWDFGDGLTMETFYPNMNGTFPVELTDYVEHSYFFPGTFTITLTVSDDDNDIDVLDTIINV